MDTTKAITHVSLCAGYGGIDIGLSRAIPSLRTVAFSEIEAFACANLVSKMEAGLMDCAPIWTDIKTFPWAEFCGRVDILSGGYPCQPFSSAGKRLGTEDPRHLWPYIADGIRAMRPRVCFFENVEGHISLGLREVVSELEGLGYKTTWGIFSAREVGAPHQRKRVFILAMADSTSDRFARGLLNGETLKQTQGNTIKRSGGDAGCGELAYDKSQRVQGCGADWLQESRPHAAQGLPLRGGEGCELVDTSDRSDPASGHAEAHRLPSEYREALCSGESGGADADAWPSRPGQPQYGWEPPRVVGDTTHGSNGQHTSQQQGRDTSGRSSAEGVSMGDTTHQGYGRLDDEQGEVGSRETRGHIDRAGSTMGNGNSINWSASPEGRQHDPKARSTSERQTQPPLGRDPHGPACGMDYAELQDADSAMRGDNIGTVDGAMAHTICGRGQQTRCECGCSEVDENQRREEGRGNQQAVVSNDKSNDGGRAYSELSISCDNRTDELRLLGNGVVPATAERAFRTLLAELIP